MDNRRRYLLLILALILASNYVDRYAFGLLLQDIKTDLALSDTQLGLMTGIAFAIFYSILGIPIARWADRGNRITIISLTTALWSAAVALCGVATGFWQLLLIRVGVAVGEAGCVPPAHSLIADLFPPAQRPRAISLYKLGWPLSVLIGYFIAGWLNQLYGWRMTIVMLGLPGLVLACLAKFTLQEPRTSVPQPVRNDRRSAQEGDQPSVAGALRCLWAIPTFRHLLLYYTVLNFFGVGINQWQPSYFVRSFGLATGELGTWLSLTHGLGGLLGVWLGGELASRYGTGRERLQLKGMALAYGLFSVLSTGIYLAANYYLAFGLMAVGVIAVSMVLGPLLATMQALVPGRIRALSIAIIYLFSNLIGLGFGPLLAGILSDAFHAWAGDQALRYALLALTPGYAWGGWHLWRASRTVERDIAAQQDLPTAPSADCQSIKSDR